MSKGKYLIILVALIAGGALALLFYLNHSLNPLKISVPSAKDMGKQSAQPEADSPALAERPSWVESVTLSPVFPRVSDNIGPKITLHNDAPSGLAFRYEWFINDKLLSNVQTATLSHDAFKKYDRISVRITPIVDGEEGASSMSSIVIVRNSPVELTSSRAVGYAADTVTVQLNGHDPDGDSITYALEEPFLEGMVIDKVSGKITWKPLKAEKGVYKFGASATDADGEKTVKTFEVTIQ
jgi:hypothetical protein